MATHTDHTTHLFDICPGLPIAADAVPLLRGGDDDVCRQQCLEVRGVITCVMIQHRLLLC